ncbi:MAG: pyridoxine 5'-phosphate synthase [Rhodothermaceae bacterium]|nr:pyridoxine 5'-phosphate synthase [Rhodothermaceae bacterium]
MTERTQPPLPHPTRLSVNLNKVALMRNARGGGRPSVRAAAEACIRAGAHGITLHPRPDGRHARAEDVIELAAWLPVELNVEGNPFAGPGTRGAYAYPGFVTILETTKPVQATLVPDAAGQRTSDHGWALTSEETARLRPLVERLQAQGSRVSLFMDPDLEAIERAAALGVDRVELYTGPYAEAFATGDAEGVLSRYVAAAERAQALGLGLNAGHDLDLDNLDPFLRAIPTVHEVSIGQALVADALHIGLDAAVRAYLEVIASASA